MTTALILDRKTGTWQFGTATRRAVLPSRPVPRPARMPVKPISSRWLFPELLQLVSACSEIPVKDICGRSLRRGWKEFPNLILPRHTVMWLGRRFTPLSYPQIAFRVGGRDHTTAIHAVRKIDTLIERHGLNGGDDPAEWARQILEAGAKP